MEAAETNISRLTFEGPYDDVFVLVEQMRAAGLAVTWTPPDQERSGVVHDIIVGLIVSGAIESVRSVVSHFVARRQVKVRLDRPDPDDSDPESE